MTSISAPFLRKLLAPDRFRLRAMICVAGASLLYLAALGRPALFEPDEGRYAEIAREMLASGDFVTPRNDWVRYFEKPPLVYWTTAASIAILGKNEFAVRLPAALASIGCIVTTLALGEAMFGAEVGVVSALSLASSPLFFGFGRFLTLDPALSLFITIALASFYKASREASFGTRQATIWMLIASAAAALGTLTKGPVALMLPALIGFLFLALRRRLGEIRQMPLLWGALIFIGITSPWFILMERRNPGFLRFFLVHEHAQRYLQSEEHGWGLWFFIPVVAAGMWPWSFFIPSAVARYRTLDERTRETLQFLAIWFGVILVFFSIPRSKLASYVLPATPAIAILAAHGLSSLAKIGTLQWFAIVSVGVAGVVAGADVIVSAGNQFGAVPLDIVLVVSLVAAGGLVAWMMAARSGDVRDGLFPLALSAVLAMAPLGKACADAAALNSYRTLASEIAPVLAGNCTLASYRHFVQSLPFYTGRREVLVSFKGELAPGSASSDAAGSFLATDRELQSRWKSTDCVVMAANRRDLKPLTELLGGGLCLIGEEGKKVAVLNRPDPAVQCRNP